MKLFTKGKILFTISLFLVFGLGAFTYPYIFNKNSVTNSDSNSLKMAKSELKLLQKDNAELSDKITATTTKTVELEKEYKDLQASNKEDIEKAVEIEKARQAEEAGYIGDGPTYPEETETRSTNGNRSFKDIEGVWYLKSEGFGEGDEGFTGYIEFAANGDQSIKFIAYAGEKEDPTIIQKTFNFRDSDQTTIFADGAPGERISMEFKDDDTVWIGLEESEAFPLYRSTEEALEANYNRVSF
ncbi:MAG: septum formation initiator family protein [Bacillus sp. (in: firmicutes)]